MSTIAIPVLRRTRQILPSFAGRGGGCRRYRRAYGMQRRWPQLEPLRGDVAGGYSTGLPGTKQSGLGSVSSLATRSPTTSQVQPLAQRWIRHLTLGAGAQRKSEREACPSRLSRRSLSSAKE